MNKTKELILENKNVKYLTFTVLLLMIATVPNLLHQQWITGPLVNAILIYTCIRIGTKEAILLGLIPGTVALASGLLNIVMAPMIPFIMLANALFVMLFHYLDQDLKLNFNKNLQSFSALFLAAFLKFLLLFLSVKLIVSNLISNEIIIKTLTLMMSWPQFFTAVAGGSLAILIAKRL